jgi:enoyl-CoA hydratase/carnithine racemase
MMEELAYALSYARHTPEVWLVVVAAQGDIFCAGADLKAFAGEAQEETNSTVPPLGQEVLLGEAVIQCHRPVIARVHGNVYAGAHMIVAACHYVVALEGVSFSLPEVKRGIFPFQVLSSLLQVMPARQALDYCMRGQPLGVEAAYALGLVTHRAADEAALDEQVATLAQELKAGGPFAIQQGLRAYDELRRTPAHEAHSYLKGLLQETLQTADAKEGIQAWKEKRPPQWQGK